MDLKEQIRNEVISARILAKTVDEAVDAILILSGVVVPRGTLCDVCGSKNTITISNKGENCDWCNPL
jgi:hypothetical protein